MQIYPIPVNDNEDIRGLIDVCGLGERYLISLGHSCHYAAKQFDELSRSLLATDQALGLKLAKSKLHCWRRRVWHWLLGWQRRPSDSEG